MKRTTYNKTCAVPMCNNTTNNQPGKLFIHVPKGCAKRRNLWLKLAGRDPKFTSVKSTIFFCEDHFDLPNDMENYIKYSLMGSVGQISMMPDCLPSKFHCQSDIIKQTVRTLTRQRLDSIQEIISKHTEMPVTHMTSNSDVIHSAAKTDNVSTNFQVKVTSKPVQNTSQAKDKNTLPLIINIKSKSPLKTKSGPKLASLRKTITSTNDRELSKIIEAKRLCKISIKNNIRLIKKKPRYYIGVPNDSYFLIDLIHKHTKLPKEHILLCLKKIRLNTQFSELGDQFGMSESYVSKNFKKSLPLIANVLRLFIIKSNKKIVKQNLPKPFRLKYHNIYCIINCLEFEIEKPSKSIEALTCSEYKRANTVKYLISSTPDGVINYISPGYGGRITDVSLVQDCGFLDSLEPGVSIITNGGFNHIEELLLQKQVNLVRLHNVSSKDVMKSKQLANLRIHIESVIRRLSEFSMLKPHSVVNKQLIKYLDDSVVIACALINLQDSIIK